MKRILLSFGLCLLMAGMSFGQLSISSTDTYFVIDFDNTLTGVNNGSFSGAGFESSPASGELDSDGIIVTGMSSGDLAFGGSGAGNTDLHRDASTGGVGTGGVYSFDISNGGTTDRALGIQPGGSDWTSGTIVLKVTNGTGSTVNRLLLYYDVYVYNDQARSNDFKFSYDVGGGSVAVSDADFTSTEAADGAPAWVKTRKAVVLSGLSITNGTTIELTWTGDDVSGSGSRDEFAIDNISVAMNQSGGQITGNDGWRLLSIPKTSATVSDISDDTAIQGVTGGSDASAASNVFTYDNTGSYETPTNVSTAISDGYGLAVYFYNNTSNGSSALPLTLDVAGTVSSANVDVTLNKNNTAGTSSGSGAADSYYTLVGNPFASNYNLNSVTVTGGAIQDNVQFWNDGTSSYSAQDRTTPYIVSPWQAFWVEVLNANAATAITFPTSGETTSSATGTFFSKENPDNADIEFTLSSESSFDEAIKLSFRSYAELGMDRADASKLVPLVSEYATMAFVGEYQNEEKLKSVESLPIDMEEAITIPLRPTLVGVSGEFTFSWNGLEELSNKMSFTLHDYETGSNIDMSEVDSYVFMAEANTASKSKSVLLPVVAESESNDAENRFGITITPNTSVGIDDELDSPTKFALDQNYPNPFNPTTNIQYSVGEAGPVTITVYNVMGQKVAELLNTTKSAGSYQVSWNATGQASGIYYYRLTAPGQVLTRQMTLIK
jgi:hypothetical protein